MQMVHAVRVKDGNATYCNRFVQTSKLEQEKKAGKPIFAAFADQEGQRGVVVAMLELLKVCVAMCCKFSCAYCVCSAVRSQEGPLECRGVMLTCRACILIGCFLTS
jgi:hypothetical protein